MAVWVTRVAVIGRCARFRGSREGELTVEGLAGTRLVRGSFSTEMRPELGFGG